MKLLSTLLASSLLAVSAGAAMADTLTLGSFGANQGKTTYVSPGFGNTVVTSTKGITYDLNPRGIWHDPTGGSSWVGLNPNDGPNDSNHEPNGVYPFQTTFVLTDAMNDSGTLTVLADDTTDVVLNGKTILSAAAFTAAQHCTVGTPNCITPVTIALTGLINGTNTLSFNVDQLYDHANGLDFSGSITGVTPEPSSLLLLGSGLSTMAGMAFRRRRARA